MKILKFFTKFAPFKLCWRKMRSGGIKQDFNQINAVAVTNFLLICKSWIALGIGKVKIQVVMYI